MISRIEYFVARLDATMAPVDVIDAMHSRRDQMCVVDVRNGPVELIKDRLPQALQIPQNVILERIDRLPKDRTIVLYCWDTWCSLAARAAVPLLERGFDVREMYGGMKAWKTLRFPTEPADASALSGQTDPVHQQLA